MAGFIKWQRGHESAELMKDVPAFMLLAQIAFRAKRTGDFSIVGLEIGEALIGDHASIGLSERQYRSAKDRLARYQLATFRATNKGTIAKLCGTIIYDINSEANNEQSDKQATDERRTKDDQTTTIKNVKNINNKRNKNVAPSQAAGDSPEPANENCSSQSAITDLYSKLYTELTGQPFTYIRTGSGNHPRAFQGLAALKQPLEIVEIAIRSMFADDFHRRNASPKYLLDRFDTFLSWKAKTQQPNRQVFAFERNAGEKYATM